MGVRIQNCSSMATSIGFYPTSKSSYTVDTSIPESHNFHGRR